MKKCKVLTAIIGKDPFGHDVAEFSCSENCGEVVVYSPLLNETLSEASAEWRRMMICSDCPLGKY